MIETYFDKRRILFLLHRLHDKLEKKKIKAELYLVGGAVMCLVFETRPSTKDIDSYFLPQEKLRPIIRDIAREENIAEGWLNDSVKGFLSEHGKFANFLDLKFLKVFTAEPHYLLAMKCLAMRLGPEFNDEDDIRYLLRHLNIETVAKALEVIAAYYPLDKFPQKSFYALEDILKN